MKTYRLNCGIEVRVEGKSGTLVGSLKESQHSNRLYNAAIDGLEALVLAHACAGKDVGSAKYQEGVESALDAIANHYS